MMKKTMRCSNRTLMLDEIPASQFKNILTLDFGFCTLGNDFGIMVGSTSDTGILSPNSLES